MRKFTLAALTERIRQRADIEDDQHVTDPEIQGLMSTAYGELHSLLNGSGLRFFESVQSIAASALTDNGDGGSYIALPDDHLHTIGVDYEDTASRRSCLVEMMVQERNVFSGTTGRNQAVAYAISGAKLVLYPTPPTTQTYKHLYVPQPLDLTGLDSSQEVDVVTADGEAFLIWHAVIAILAKREMDPNLAMAERERARERVREDALRRALNNARRVIVEDHQDGYRDDASIWWARRG